MKHFVLVSFCSMLQMIHSFSLCPQGWQEFQDDCYFVNATTTTLSKARHFCSKFGNSSKLLSLRSSEQKQFLSDLVTKMVSINANGQAVVWTNAVETSASHFEWPEDRVAIEGVENVNSCVTKNCCGLQMSLSANVVSLKQSPCVSNASVVCVKSLPHANWTSIEFVGKKLNSLFSRQMSFLSSMEAARAKSHFSLANDLQAVKFALSVSMREIDLHFAQEASAMYNLSILVEEMKQEQSLREEQTEYQQQIQLALASLHKKTLSLESSLEHYRGYFDGKVDMVLVMLRDSKKILSEIINSKNFYSHSQQQGTLLHGNVHHGNSNSLMIIVIFCFFFTLASLTINILLFRQLAIIKSCLCCPRRSILGFNHESSASNDQLTVEMEMRGRQI